MNKKMVLKRISLIFFMVLIIFVIFAKTYNPFKLGALIGIIIPWVIGITRLPESSGRKIIKRTWRILAALVMIMIIFPVGLNFIRVGIISGLIILWISGLLIFWRNKFILSFFIATAVILGLVVFIPGTEGNIDGIRTAYVRTLLDYEGVGYGTGGENTIEIDSSGLVREGYIHANIGVGIKTLNPKLIRRAFFIWWNDCSVNALEKEYKQMTKLVKRFDSIGLLNYKMLNSGDLIIPEAGVKASVYIGNQMWIEADILKGRVLKKSTELKAKEWGNHPIKLLRWSNLYN